MQAVLHLPPEIESTPQRRSLGRRIYFGASSKKRSLLDAFNQVAGAKAQLVRSGQLSPSQFVRELDKEARRQGFELTIEAYRTFAELFAAYQEHGQALKFYQRVWNLDPDAFESLADLGAGYGRLGRYEESLRYLQQALERRPKNPRVLNNLGATYHALGQKEKAIESFRQARDADPNYATPLLNEGNLLCESGNHEGALGVFGEAIKLEHPPVAYVLTGFCQMELGRYPEALESFQTAANLGLDDPPVRLNMASALLALGRLTEANGILESFANHARTKLWLNDKAVVMIFEDLRKGVTRANEMMAAPGRLRLLNDRQLLEGAASVRATIVALRERGFGPESAPRASGDSSADVV